MFTRNSSSSTGSTSTSGTLGPKEIAKLFDLEWGITLNEIDGIEVVVITPTERLPTTDLTPTSGPISSPPDGGRDAWLTVVGGWCAFLVALGWLNNIGVFQEYYQRHILRHYSPSVVSWITSTEIFFLFIGGPVVGKLFDSYGPRYLLLVGSILHVFGLMMTSLSTKYYQFFLAQSVCSAIGCSAILYSSMNAVSTWFLRKRATAIGIIASGSSLGGVFLPIMVTKLIPKVGFGWAIRAVAFLYVGLLVIANLTVKSRLNHTKEPVRIMDFVTPLHEPPFLLLTLASFFYYLGIFLPANFIILQGQAEGMSVNLSNYLVSISNAASIFGRILPGIIADHLGCFNTMITITFITAILVFTVWIPGNGGASIITFAALNGFFSGAFVSLGPALAAQISNIRQIGVRNGTVYFVVSFSALVGNPIGGALVSNNGTDFLGLQIWCGVTLLMGSLLIVASRIAKAGFKLNIF